jgi:hypothetical protein
MPDEISHQSTLGTETGGESAAQVRTAAETMLLQQHQLLLARSIIMQVTYRLMAALVVAFSLLRVVSSVYTSIVIALLVGFVTSLWHLENQLVASRIADLEKVLAKKNRMAFEQIYIDYRFESTMHTGRFRVLRIEPLLWFFVVVLVLLFGLLAR